MKNCSNFYLLFILFAHKVFNANLNELANSKTKLSQILENKLQRSVKKMPEKSDSLNGDRKPYDLKIIIEDINKLRGKTLITGFHGLGNIGHLTVRYIVESALKQGLGKKIGYIVSRIMPPFVEVLNGGSFGAPYEFIEVNNVVLLLIRFQPTLEEQALLADKITELAKKAGLKCILLMGGIDITAFPDLDNAQLVFVANDEFKSNIIARNNKWDLTAAPKGIFVTGGVALFLTYATHRNIPAAALFAPTEKGVINREQALNLAKKIVKILDLPISLEEIEKEIAATTDMIRKMQEQLMKETQKEQVSEDLSELFT